MPGGSGPMIDINNNIRIHDLILGFLHQDKLIAPECYCVTALAFARELEDRKSIIAGKHVTGHAVEYDWHEGTGVMGINADFRWPFYPLEYILRDATQPGGQYHGGVGRTISTILDYPFPDRTLDTGLAPGRRIDGRSSRKRSPSLRLVKANSQSGQSPREVDRVFYKCHLEESANNAR